MKKNQPFSSSCRLTWFEPDCDEEGRLPPGVFPANPYRTRDTDTGYPYTPGIYEDTLLPCIKSLLGLQFTGIGSSQEEQRKNKRLPKQQVHNPTLRLTPFEAFYRREE